jgi:hypothetical protein
MFHMATLTPRQRLLRCYFHEPLDRPGIFCRTGIPRDDPSYDPLRKLLAERTECKVAFNASSLLQPLPIQTAVSPHSDDWERWTSRLTTPAGELVSTGLRSLKRQPGMVEKHFLCNLEDIERYLSLPPQAVAAAPDAFFDLDRQIGDGGIVDVALGLNPAGRVAELLGSEHLALISITDREVVHALCQRQMHITLDLLDVLLAAGVGPCFSMLGQEYVVPPLHGRADFIDFNVQYDKPIIDRIHAGGGRVHIHCHGRIASVLDCFLDMGADVLHPIEPPPMGDVTARCAKDVLRGRVCIEGNLQIADMYERTAGEIAAQTRKLIVDAFDDRRGLIVCPSASPYIYGAGGRCVEQFRAMIDAVHEVTKG